MTSSRRQLLLRSLFGAGAVGLRAFATGLPVAFLMDPTIARAQPAPGGLAPQFLMLSVQGGGSPLNVNMPGSFVPGVSHSADPAMAPTPLTIGGTSSIAALPWSTLPQSVLNRTCFFHYATQTIVHPDLPKVLRLFNNVREEMTVSLCAQALQAVFGTIQAEPIAFSGSIQANGRALANLSANGVGQTLTNSPGALQSLQRLRDSDLDRLNALFKANGTKAERDYLDKFALSQRQVREISQTLLQALSTIQDNSIVSQMTAACILFKMNVAAAATIGINFGGDLHTDAGFKTETASCVSAVATIGQLFTTILPQFGLQDQVTLSIMDVFGRQLTSQGGGRGHYGSHCGGFMIGKNVKPGVVGGLVSAPSGALVASPIASATGAMDPAGDIPLADSLSSYGKTLAALVGVPPATIAGAISKGKVVQGAIAAA